MPPLRRGTCPTCGRVVALRKGDLVREHARPLNGGQSLRNKELRRAGYSSVPAPTTCKGSGHMALVVKP